MLVDQRGAGQCFLAAMLAPCLILSQLELEAETGVQHMEGGDNSVQDVASNSLYVDMRLILQVGV